MTRFTAAAYFGIALGLLYLLAFALYGGAA